jgi:uncharacterized protein YbjT (DUF2867 family)
LVVGASGRVGRAVVAELHRLGRPVRALVRRPPPTPFPPGVEIVTGDLTDPDSLTPALAGVEAVFLVWAAGPATVSAVVARLARTVSRVVFLSSPHQTPHPFFRQPKPMAALHANIERELAMSGLPSVILRPGMYAANTVAWWAPQIRAGDVVRWPYGAVETRDSTRALSDIVTRMPTALPVRSLAGLRSATEDGLFNSWMGSLAHRPRATSPLRQGRRRQWPRRGRISVEGQVIGV